MASGGAAPSRPSPCLGSDSFVSGSDVCRATASGRRDRDLAHPGRAGHHAAAGAAASRHERPRRREWRGGKQLPRVRRGRDRHGPHAAGVGPGPGGHGARPRRVGPGTTDRAFAGLSARARQHSSATRRTRPGRAGGVAARQFHLPPAACSLFGRPVGADRSQHRAGRALGPRRAAAQQAPRARKVVQGHIPDRRRRRARDRDRAVGRLCTDPCGGSSVLAHQPRRGRRSTR